MDEAVFFNPGDAIANDYDYAAARRSAQIFKAQDVADKGLVIVQDQSGKFSVFYEAAAVDAAAGKKPASQYTIMAHI